VLAGLAGCSSAGWYCTSLHESEGAQGGAWARVGPKCGEAVGSGWRRRGGGGRGGGKDDECGARSARCSVLVRGCSACSTAQGRATERVPPSASCAISRRQREPMTACSTRWLRDDELTCTRRAVLVLVPEWCLCWWWWSRRGRGGGASEDWRVDDGASRPFTDPCAASFVRRATPTCGGPHFSSAAEPGCGRAGETPLHSAASERAATVLARKLQGACLVRLVAALYCSTHCTAP